MLHKVYTLRKQVAGAYKCSLLYSCWLLLYKLCRRCANCRCGWLVLTAVSLLESSDMLQLHQHCLLLFCWCRKCASCRCRQLVFQCCMDGAYCCIAVAYCCIAGAYCHVIAALLMLTTSLMMQEVSMLQHQLAGATAQTAALQARLSLTQAQSPGFFARQLATSNNSLHEVSC